MVSPLSHGDCVLRCRWSRRGQTTREAEGQGADPLHLTPSPGCSCTRAACGPGADSHPSPGARATHKFEDEEQVREGDEDREAAGEGAAPRRRCGGHAGGLRRPGDGTRGSSSAVTDLWLGGAQWPGASARGLRAGGRRSPGRRPPHPRCRRARPRGLGRRASCSAAKPNSEGALRACRERVGAWPGVPHGATSRGEQDNAA